MSKKDITFSLGDVVVSKSGRDSESLYIITKIIDKDFIEVVNGDTRKLANPKKKRIKHVAHTGFGNEIIANKIKEDKKIYDSEIYSAIKNCGIDRHTK